MLRDLAETWLSLKVGAVVVSSPWVMGLFEFLNWLDESKLDFGVWASFLLTVVLIISHFINIRKNSEEANLRIELLKLELKEKQEGAEDDNPSGK